ncbi:MAG: ABC transporter permease [Saprospiraceae bacterium]|nr:MAG: ABC transporter permease [Saprospiraceae bacterium]
MLFNYFKIAIRNLWKFKFYSLINILGLAAGITAFLFIFLYVTDELNYDAYHPRVERIYRADVDGQLGGQELRSADNGAPFGPTLRDEFPEVEDFTRLRSRSSYLVKYDNNHFREDEVIFADSNLFQFFSIPLIQGDVQSALRAPNSIVISEEMANKYFGQEDPMGKVLVLDNNEGYKVTGVRAEMPDNTDLKFDFYASLGTLEESRSNQWGNMNFTTFLLLREGTDATAFTDKFSPIIVKKYFAPEVEKYIGQSWDDFIAGGNRFSYILFPLKDIHLHSDKGSELGANGDIKYVWIFSIIGLFILLIACINFINLSTARSAIRAKEIGIRKVVGAQKRHLFVQFLSESFLLSVLSMLVAALLVKLFFPYFNDLSGKQLAVSQLFSTRFLITVLALIPLIGLLAGSYPAVFLSRFKVVNVLKGGLFKGKTKDSLRNSLVVFQFLITVALISGTLVVYKQLQYIQDKNLGFDRDHLLILNDVYALQKNVQAFKTKAQAYPEVENATVSSFLPVPSIRNTTSFFLGRNPEQDKIVILNNWDVDEDYIPTMGIKMAEGRNFSTDFLSDSTAVVINQRMAQYFGDEDPIGKEISEFGDNDELVVYKIIGIIEDFHFSSLRQSIDPLAFFLKPSSGFMTLRLNGNELSTTIQKLKGDWETMAPGQPFAYTLMDERFNRMYDGENQIGKIIGAFSILAIFIATIGLLGLVSFAAQQRTKEIGIRKVLGASMASIVGLLSRDFIRLILIALLIAIPLTWYAMNQWLENFAYRANIPWWIFVVAGLVAIVIALLTVSFQTIKAALANPVKSLRNE